MSPTSYRTAPPRDICAFSSAQLLYHKRTGIASPFFKKTKEISDSIPLFLRESVHFDEEIFLGGHAATKFLYSACYDSVPEGGVCGGKTSIILYEVYKGKCDFMDYC